MIRENSVYVVGAGRTYFRKVGSCSANLMSRLRNLQVGNPHLLSFVLIIQFDNPSEASAAELTLIGKLKSEDTEPCVGEWTHIPCSDSEFCKKCIELVGGQVLFRTSRTGVDK